MRRLMALACLPIVLIAGCGSSPAGSAGADPSLSPTLASDGPAVGQQYPFELYTHCGIRSAEFGGRYWSAIAPTDQPYPGGREVTAGTMTLISADLLRFTWASGTSDFKPTDVKPLPCQ